MAAAPAITGLDHVALRVADLAASRRFYREVLGLAEIARPGFSFPGAWFDLGTGRSLHLIAGADVTSGSGSRGNHFALAVASTTDWARHLEQVGIACRGPAARPDGALQIFLADPDGHTVELCQPEP